MLILPSARAATKHNLFLNDCWTTSKPAWFLPVAMAPEGLRVFSSWSLFCSASLATTVLLAVSTSFTIIDAATWDPALASWRGIAIAAAILDGVALLSIFTLTLFAAFFSDQWIHRRLLPWAGVLVAVMAAALSLIILVVKRAHPQHASRSEEMGSSDPAQISVVAEFALWALAVIAEVTFYAFVVMRRTPAQDQRVSYIAEKSTKRAAPERPPPPPTALRIITPPYALPEAGMPAPDFDTSKKGRRLSWRDSLHQAVRPRNSKTALLISRSSLSRDSSVISDTRSIATTAQSDGFDSWDTSNVDPSIREALSPTIPSRGRTLETIPGSRPASPAKALDGPFRDPLFSASPASSILERPATALSRHDRPPTAQSTYSKRTFIPSSRPTSPSTNESHIHPLFRSDSPTPAPGTTPGTVVTASPIGGQVMPPPPARSASRMRSESYAGSRTGSRAGSRAPSPATFTRDASLDERPSLSSTITEHRSTFAFKPESDEPNSRNATMTSTSSAYPGTVATNSIISTTSRSRSSSPSPISRPLTPPIPEFILSASKERLSSKNSRETLRSTRSRETVRQG